MFVIVKCIVISFILISEEDHTEEYQSLCVRCEAVAVEIEDIKDKMTAFDKRIEEEKEQINNITSAEDRIHMEIQNLRVCSNDLRVLSSILNLDIEILKINKSVADTVLVLPCHEAV